MATTKWDWVWRWQAVVPVACAWAIGWLAVALTSNLVFGG